MGEEKISEIRAQIKEKEAKRHTAVTVFQRPRLKIEEASAQMAFDTFDAFKVWGFESPHTKCDNRCRECMWFDPAYDLCYFFGTARIDDLACESFQSAE